MIKLSIIITLYKSEAYIRKCLDSIFVQDIPRSKYEVIVVDDGSPDKSADIVSSYSKQFQNLKLIVQENKGLAEARNVGLRHAIGKYVRFVDPDDYIESHGNSMLLRKMEEEDLDMLRFDYTMVNETYETLPDFKSQKYKDYRDKITDGKTFLGGRLGFECFVWAFIYRKQIITANSLYFISGTYFDDVHWLPIVLQHAKRVTSVRKKLLYYLQRPGSLVKVVDETSMLNMIDGQLRIIDLFINQIANDNSRQVKRWYLSMLAHTVISVLRSVSRNFFDSRGNFLKLLKERHVYPLFICDSTFLNHLYVWLINFSPNAYCWLIQLKKRILTWQKKT